MKFSITEAKLELRLEEITESKKKLELSIEINTEALEERIQEEKEIIAILKGLK